MRTIILSTAIKVLMPVFLGFSIYIFFRGHSHPGGGFIAALITSIGLIFHMMAFGPEVTRKTYRLNAFRLMGWGLSCALVAAVFSLTLGGGFLEAQWIAIELPFFGKPGTPILFDLGVYLLVVGVTLKIAQVLFES